MSTNKLPQFEQEAEVEREKIRLNHYRREHLRLQDRYNQETAKRFAGEVTVGNESVGEQLQRLFSLYLDVWATTRRNQNYNVAATRIEVELAEIERNSSQYGLLIRYTLCKVIAQAIRIFCFEEKGKAIMVGGGKPTKEGNSHYASELAEWVEMRHKLLSALQLLEGLKKPLKNYRRIDAVTELSVPQEAIALYKCSAEGHLSNQAPAIAQPEPVKTKEDPRDLEVTLDHLLAQGLTTKASGKYTAKQANGKDASFDRPSLDEICRSAGLYEPETGKRRPFKKPSSAPGKTRAVFDVLTKHDLRKGTTEDFISKLNARYATGVSKLPQTTEKHKNGTNEPYSTAKANVEELISRWNKHTPSGSSYEKIGQKIEV